MRRIALVLLALLARPCLAAEELITTALYANGDSIPYILNSNAPAPRYLIILFPGGAGNVNPRMQEGKLIYDAGGNFLLRSRQHIVDDEFATVTTNTTQSPERIQALLDDLKRRFPDAQVYLMGTSYGTGATMALAGYLSDKIAGEIHTASVNTIHAFDARKYRNRHLVVHHKGDPCNLTTFDSARASHEKYGNEFIAMEGGVSIGDRCEAFSYHGFNGIERETMAAIKNWVKRN